MPQWAASPPESLRRWNAEAALRPDPGRHFWAFVTTLPLTLLTLANLVAAWRARDAWAAWWLGAAALIFVERLATFFYFIPAALTLRRVEAFSDSKVRAMVSRWVHLNYARNAAYLVACVIAQVVLAAR